MRLGDRRDGGLRMLYVDRYNESRNIVYVKRKGTGETFKMSREQVFEEMSNGVVIQGVHWDGSRLTVLRVCDTTILLDSLEVGMPVRYKLGNRNWKHALFGGTDGEKYAFVDLGTNFTFSREYLCNNQDKMKFSSNNLDPVEVQKIVQQGL